MQAAVLDRFGGPEVLSMTDVPAPMPREGHVVVDVRATALNHADLLQRRGVYGLGTALPAVLGIECAGTIRSVGASVADWSVGDRVCALVSGGAYAEQVSVPVTQLLPLPAGMDFTQGAALPEVAATVWSNLLDIARLQPDESVLIHGGSGGVGSFAIQLARVLGCRVFTTAGSADKVRRCVELGAQCGICYRDEDFVQVVQSETEGRGADVILDNMGAAYLPRNVDALAHDGRIAMIGLQGGREGPVPLARMMAKRASLFTTSLRDRSPAAKARIMAGVARDIWPHLEAGRIRPLVDRVFNLGQMAAAHSHMESGSHFGKVIVRVCDIST